MRQLAIALLLFGSSRAHAQDVRVYTLVRATSPAANEIAIEVDSLDHLRAGQRFAIVDTSGLRAIAVLERIEPPTDNPTWCGAPMTAAVLRLESHPELAQTLRDQVVVGPLPQTAGAVRLLPSPLAGYSAVVDLDGDGRADVATQTTPEACGLEPRTPSQFAMGRECVRQLRWEGGGWRIVEAVEHAICFHGNFF